MVRHDKNQVFGQNTVTPWQTDSHLAKARKQRLVRHRTVRKVFRHQSGKKSTNKVKKTLNRKSIEDQGNFDALFVTGK